MLDKSQKIKVIYIIGPTAVGKTALSIELALRLGGEIVSADSRYLYKGMDIGTAKPSKEELNKVPHHLIDVADPDENCSIANYQEKVKESIHLINQRIKIPILVGGTGQYYRAFVEGWSLPQVEPNIKLRDYLMQLSEEIGTIALHKRLQVIDSSAAKSIDPMNVRRTIRALEVILTTGHKFSDLRQRREPEYDFFVVGLAMDRAFLYKKVDERIDKMIKDGLIGEVEALRNKGYDSRHPAMSAIGYSEIESYLDGKYELDIAIQIMKKRTRNFIRRQANWFKPTDPTIHWYAVEQNPNKTIVEDITRWWKNEE